MEKDSHLNFTGTTLSSSMQPFWPYMPSPRSRWIPASLPGSPGSSMKAFACINVYNMFNLLNAFIPLITKSLTGYLELLTGKLVETATATDVSVLICLITRFNENLATLNMSTQLHLYQECTGLQFPSYLLWQEFLVPCLVYGYVIGHMFSIYNCSLS